MSAIVTLHLRLICHNPPLERGDVVFGLQDKDRVLHQGQPADDGSLVFECDVTAVPGVESKAYIRGAFAHGPAAGRFLYLSLRPVGAKDDNWVRRIKIPLSSITWEQASSGNTLEARVDGRKSGSVALIGGAWTASG
jgi:hypothetical protein